MKDTYLKSDLLKVLILTSVFLVALITLRVWDNNTAILDWLASKWF